MPRPFRRLDYEKALARAWVAAGQGAVSEAIGLLKSAAETAAVNERFAAEVVCLQTATQFGDRSCEARLRELEGTVEGPRAGLAARFAGAMEKGDAAELAAVSEAFEEMGDRVAAVDAAAQAALTYRRQDLRGSALGCAARAEALAAEVRSGYADAAAGEGAAAADGSGTRDRVVDRPGLDEQRRGGATDAVDAHRRRPHLPGDEQDRHHEPRRTRRAAVSAEAADSRIAAGYAMLRVLRFPSLPRLRGTPAQSPPIVRCHDLRKPSTPNHSRRHSRRLGFPRRTTTFIRADRERDRYRRVHERWRTPARRTSKPGGGTERRDLHIAWGYTNGFSEEDLIRIAGGATRRPSSRVGTWYVEHPVIESALRRRAFDAVSRRGRILRLRHAVVTHRRMRQLRLRGRPNWARCAREAVCLRLMTFPRRLDPVSGRICCQPVPSARQAETRLSSSQFELS